MPDAFQIAAFQIAQMQDDANAHWHEASLPVPIPVDAFTRLVLEQHRANFDLWHQEDAARDPLASDEAISTVKHNIDRLNQERNDLAESIDLLLLEEAGLQEPTAPQHSETPGMMIDRLSILALKIFHTGEEIHRAGVAETHQERNRLRLSVLQEQREDLVRCLDELWADVAAKQRRFKLYRQMKMYNDPALNPMIYKLREGAQNGS